MGSAVHDPKGYRVLQHSAEPRLEPGTNRERTPHQSRINLSPHAHPPHRPRSRPRLCRARRPRVAVPGAACVPGSPRAGAGPAPGRRRERGEDRAGDERRDAAGGVVPGTADGRRRSRTAPSTAFDRPRPPSPALLWFYGNGENIATIWPILREFQPSEAALLVADYPGYGGSDGRASEAGMYAAADAAYAALAARPEVDPRRIFVYGRSLGSAAATYTATRHPVAGLILESPFTNAADMARDAYRILPRFILRLSLDNLGRIKQVRCPLLLFHGTDDRLVPVRMGMRVAAAAAGPVEVVLIQASGHNETYEAGGESYRSKVAQFVR